jgi:diacylglycerol O-acyltransferase
MEAFRRRLMTVPLGLDHPRWVDDPGFDLDNHLHRVAVPSPGDRAEFARLAAAIMGRTLSPEQPPWEMHVVEGLAGGRIGLIAKVHHAVIDGVAGAQLMAQLLDLTAAGSPVTECAPWRPPELPSSTRLMGDAMPHLLTSPVRTVRAVREVGRTAVRLARRALDGGSGPLSIPLGAPDTFATPVGADRTVSFAELPLEQITAVKRHFGATLNDVVLAVSSGALRAHLQAHGEPSESPLVAVVPVSVRGLHGRDELGNRLSAMFVPLANDRDCPVARLAAVREASVSTKAQEKAVGYGPLAAAVSEAVPPLLAIPALRLGNEMGVVRRLRAGNLMVSNVPGPRFPLYFAGMKMEALHPLGPVIDGVALNITVQSYLDSVFVGINAGSTAVPDLPALARAMVEDLAELAALAKRAEMATAPAAPAASTPAAQPASPTRRPPARTSRARPAAATSRQRPMETDRRSA